MNCQDIVAKSSRLSCSATIEPNDVTTAQAIADCILRISHLTSSSEENEESGFSSGVAELLVHLHLIWTEASEIFVFALPPVLVQQQTFPFSLPPLR
jgi:hypothetical protein